PTRWPSTTGPAAASATTCAANCPTACSCPAAWTTSGSPAAPPASPSRPPTACACSARCNASAKSPASPPHAPPPPVPPPTRAPPDAPAALDAWLAALDQGRPGVHLWHLYQNETDSARPVMERLHSSDTRVTFYAATLLAMWNRPEGEAPLIAALTRRETGPT